jgi:hypothetical protein
MNIRVVPVAAGLAVASGIAIAGASLASAEGSSPTVTAAYQPAVQGEATPGQARQGGMGNGNTDPSKPMRSDEHLLTGTTARKVTAAAKAKEPRATIQRVETDSDGVYEAHMVRADGTQVIVQVGKDFTVTGVLEGGPGGPGGQGRGGPGGGAAPGGTTPQQGESSSTTT